MKRLRFCYLCSVARLFFTASLTGRREFFLLLFMLAFVAVYALALNFWTILSFTFVQELSAPSGMKGGLVHLKIHIHNDKPFPFTLMKITVETVTPSDKTAVRFNLSPKDSIFFEIPLYCAYRGEFNVGMTVIDVTDIFGLFHIRYDLRVLPYYRQRKLKIYPKIMVLRLLPAGMRDSKVSGNGATQQGGGDNSFSNPRDYRTGDAFKQIHWTASARTRKLISKDYEPFSQPTALIVVDNAENGLDGEALLQYADLACECACAIARYCSGKNRMVKLISADAPGTGFQNRVLDHFSAIYEKLAVLPFNVKGALLENIWDEIKKDASLYAIYILTRGHDTELDRLLAGPVKMGCDVKYLLLNAGNQSERFDPLLQSGASYIEISYGDDVSAILEGFVR